MNNFSRSSVSTVQPSIDEGDWVWIQSHQCMGKVVEKSFLWGNTIFRVWLPSTDAVIRVSISEISPVQSSSMDSHYLSYIASAAKIADTLTQDILLAPIESSVIPLPHQIKALSRAMSGDRVRYLLADEVGLGKTIEAGLIMRELKLRGLVRRTLVVAPKGLVNQWVAEMRTHFNEHFQLILPDDIRTISRISALAGSDANASVHDDLQARNGNPWTMFSQVVVPMDSVKPLEKRRGWSKEQVEMYNRERFEALVSARWDLIIVDEAHRLGGSTDQVARFKLGQSLAEAAPYLLLLSATPHQGKTDAFHRLLSLLDAQEFPDIGSVTRERVQRYVIRTEKRRAIDAEGKPLFKPRRTQLVSVSWGERHRDQKLLYDAVTEYVREGYNQAMLEKRTYIGFLMILMQRLVASSTNAIKTALERRLAVLIGDENEQLSQTQFSDDAPSASSSAISLDEIYDMDGQEQVDMLVGIRTEAIRNEQSEVKLLLDIASRCEQSGPDVKAEALLDWLYRLQSEENDPDLKVLVFTEFVPTQEMLYRFLSERGFSVVCLNGSMSMEDRSRVQEAFARDARILISTDAGGEGLNLQFCHVVINYDIPWNPMRLEQRIGRVDRIGQTHTVRAINFVLEGSVEHRVLEVLEKKLAVIMEELGIDKTSDVLDSAQAEQIFDEMYIEAILNPEKVEASVENVLARFQEHAREAHKTASVLSTTEDLEPGEAQRMLNHPLPYWVEKMTVSFLSSQGDGRVEKNAQGWKITWPDGTTYENVVFSAKEAERIPFARHLTLEDPRVRGLVMRLHRFAPGQPIPVVSIPGLSRDIRGMWSLWQILLISQEMRIMGRHDAPVTLDSGPEIRRRRIMPLFLADNGMVYIPTARHVWDQLLSENVKILSFLDADASRNAFEKLQKVAEEHGKPLYEALVQEHLDRIAREREKVEYAFAAYRKSIERLGLPQVRNHRLNLLAQEERNFYEQLEQKKHACPELSPLIVIRIDGSA